jgi:trimethylamine--corrinoid protein Co-methyltransferase
VITGELWKLLDDTAMRRIDEAAVRLLTHSGCRIEHEGLLDLLEGAGCRIERSGRRCYFPENLVREALEHLGGRGVGATRCGCPLDSEEVQVPVGWNPQHRLGHGGSYPHLLDWPSGQRRLATRQDVIDMAKMAHTLDEFSYVGKVLTCAEVDQRIEPLWAAVQLAEITDKPIGGGEIFYAETIEPLVRLGEVLSSQPGDTSLVASCDFFIAPLILDHQQAECFLVKRRFGLLNNPGTMPISGLSAPVTIAGTVTVAFAELMVGWVLGYVVAPDLPAGGIVSTGSLDMRTLAACFGSPEAMLQDAATVQICRRLYGIPIHAATGYVDCKRPGLEAVFQKMYPLVGAPFGTGLFAGGGGLLSAGQDYSPVQHLLEAEINKAIERFWGTFEVDEETIAVDLIEEMMRRPQTNFLDTEHTLRHFRSEQWYPKWFDRTRWQEGSFETEAERKMLERIDGYCKDALRRYQRPEIDPGKIAELRRIFRAAERKILGG